MNWLQGLAMGVGGMALLWLLVRTLLNHFKPQIIGFVIKKLLPLMLGFIDAGLDWIRDHQDKGTAKVLRDMAMDVFNKMPMVAKKELYDGD